MSLAPGGSGPITINLTVTGNQAGTATFEVYRNWSLSGGLFSGSNPQTFTVNPRTGQDPATTFSATGTVSVGAGQASGTFTLAVGAFNITNSNTTGGKLAAGNASSYSVSVAPTNTAPHVSVGGVTNGASYEYGSVPAASCTVTDAEDASPSATPTFSAITGPLSTYGLGSQTASCSYTDGGGLSDSASATYSIVDTTKPTLNTPGDQTLEATGPSGATATWSGPTGSDNVALAAGSPSCDVTSPHTFDLGAHTVNCSETDVAGNTKTGSFTVTVKDTTGPNVTAPADVTEEATSSTGATVTYSGATASDTHDGVLTPTCVPASGSAFAIGDTTVTCSATDSSSNTGSASFQVHVVDTTPPTVNVPGDMTVEATGAAGAPATFSVEATDIVDGPTTVTCDHDSGDTFPLGTTVVSCSSTDAHSNTGSASFKVTVEDTTPPTVTVPAGKTVEATGPDGATASFSASATDLVDGNTAVTCDPASGSTFALGDTTVTCSSTDSHSNTGTDSFTVTVQDTTAPTLHLPGNITKTATSAAGADASFTATADDLVDGSVPVTCVQGSGSTFAPGANTVNCSATDSHNNTATGSFTVTVNFGWNGFFAPVDNNGVLNTIKGGQSVPLKWNIPNGSGGWISSLNVVSSIRQATFTCTAGAPTDDVEAPTSGQTSLRYDTTANQYIYNLQSPKTSNTCYKVTVSLTDGSSRFALFKTK